VSNTKNIHFNALPESTRQRLTATLTRTGAPQPLATDPYATAGGSAGWIFLSVLALGGLGAFMALDFGSRWGSGFFHEPLLGLVYVAALFIAFYGLLAAVRQRRRRKALPFPPGRYLLPLEIVDARTPMLRIRPLAQITRFDGVHQHRNGVYSYTQLTFYFEDGSEGFMVYNKAEADGIMARLKDTQAALAAAFERKQFEAIVPIDPFIDARLEGIFERGDTQGTPAEPTSGPVAHKSGGLLEWASIPAMVLAVIFAVPAYGGRNYLSDEATYQAIKDSHDIYDLEHYARHGYLHVDEVNNELIPRVKWENAEKAGTVTALRTFLTEQPKSKYAKKARKAIKNLYIKSYKDFEKQASREDPNLLPFMKAMLKFMEQKNIADVAVRFRAPDTRTLEGMDALKSVTGDPIAPVSPYFTAERNTTREAVIVRKLDEAFQTIFPRDVFKMAHGEHLGDKKLKKVKEPTFQITYQIYPSEFVYTSSTNNRTFQGIRMTFEVSMRIPKTTDRLDFTLTVEPPPNFSVSYNRDYNDYGTGGPSDSAVYDVMAARAFDQLSEKLRSVFFDKDSEAFKTGRPVPAP